MLKRGNLYQIARRIHFPSTLRVSPFQKRVIRSQGFPLWYRYSYTWDLTDPVTGNANLVSIALLPAVRASAVAAGSNVNVGYWGLEYVNDTFVKSPQFYLSWIRIRIHFERRRDLYKKRISIARMKRSLFPITSSSSARSGWTSDVDYPQTVTGWNTLWTKRVDDVPFVGVEQNISETPGDSDWRTDFTKDRDINLFIPVHRIFRTHDGYPPTAESDWLYGSYFNDYTYIHFDHEFMTSSIYNATTQRSQIVKVYIEFFVNAVRE